MNVATYTIMFEENEQPWLEYIYVKEASKVLNGAAFKLYIYFSSFSNESEIVFSPSKYIKEFGGGLTSARRAFEELVEKKYLTLINNNTFLFSRLTKMD